MPEREKMDPGKQKRQVPISATKKLSKSEKIRDEAMRLFTAFLPGIGSFDSGTDHWQEI